jgi:dsDNA-binding SOS-regulon protein
VYRGDGSDKLSVHEWEELMFTYLRRRHVELGEQHQEMLSRLMGKARDIVKITLRSNPSLKPHENPKVIINILKQHFSGVACSSMPLADFYSTVPVAGENPVEYWIRLNKAVDAAEEGLSRQGRHIDDLSREVTMMFVKYCPDPSLAAVLRFKAPEKWTAGEIQEHVDRYQINMREQLNTRPNRHEQCYVKVCSAATAGVKIIAQNTHRVEPNYELFYAPVDVNNMFQMQGMLDSGSMACTFSGEPEERRVRKCCQDQDRSHRKWF